MTDPSPDGRLGANRVVEYLALLGLLGCLALLLEYPGLPDQIPHHYNGAGVPDAWGPKGLFFLLPVLALVQYGLLSGVSLGVRAVLAASQGGLTCPAAGPGPFFAWLKMEIVWMMAYLEWQTLRVAHGQADGLGWYFLPVLLTVLLGTLAWQVVRMRRQAGQGPSG
jgi:hypothetical protein